MRQFALAGLVLSRHAGRCRWCGCGRGEPSAAESSELARLAEALAATEAKEGKTSPYLLPVIEQIARFRLRQATWPRRRRCAGARSTSRSRASAATSASAAEAMVALALLDDRPPPLSRCRAAADRRRNARWTSGSRRSSGDRGGHSPALARVALARGEPRKPAKGWRGARSISRAVIRTAIGRAAARARRGVGRGAALRRGREVLHEALARTASSTAPTGSTRRAACRSLPML